MAELKKMYKGIANSPQTYLTQSLVEEGTVIYIADGRALGTLPNLAVIGDDVNAETILVNSKREDGGYEVTRAIEGSAKAWDRMSVIARNYTNYDDETIKDNIMLINEESSKNKSDIESIPRLQIANNLNEEIEGKVLDATQGRILKQKVDEAFQLAGEGKKKIATALAGKGIQAGETETFQEYAEKIGQIKKANGDALAENVLADKKFSNDDDTNIVGTMVNHGAKIFKPSMANIIIPKGFHDGTGYIEGDSDLVASNIVQGKQIFGVQGNANILTQSEKQRLVDLINGMGGTVSGNSSFSDILQVLNSLIVRNNYSERVTCSVIKNTNYTNVSNGGNSTHSYTNGLITQHIKIPPKYAKRGRRFLFTIYRRELKSYHYDNASTGFVRGSYGVYDIHPKQEIDEKNMPEYISPKLYFYFVVAGNDAVFEVRREFNVERPKEEGYPDEQYVLQHLKKSYDVYFI